MSVLVLLGALVGAVIGAAASVATQQVAVRAEAKRERLARADARRMVRLEAIEAFLDAAQVIDQVASHKPDRPDEPIHQLWVRYHRLAIVASDQIQALSHL